MKLLLATDFDGTASPITPEAEQSAWEPAAWTLFSQLADRRDVTLAVISGRPIADVFELTRGLACFRSGSFGAEVHSPDGTVLRTHPRFTRRFPEFVMDGVARADMWLEDKPHGVALHWRNTDGEGHDHVVQRFIEWAETRALGLVHGRRVIEAVEHGFDKASALELIASTVGADLVLYCGDDVSDETALIWAASRGTAFFVQNFETRVGPTCVHVQSVHQLWQRVADVVTALLDD